jgi:hypothetical protein
VKVWLEGRGRSAESESENAIFVGYQPEAGCCMSYDCVSLDRQILARQDHLENARLKKRRAPPSETSEH